jgi:membrane protein required for colicin V production
MTLVDWIIVVVVAGAVLAGIARGFFRSVFSLAGLIVGVTLAAWNYWRIGAVLKPLIHSVEVADAVGFLIIALLVMVVAAIIGSLLAKFFEKVGLGCLDRMAGALFGFVEGLVFVALGFLRCTSCERSGYSAAAFRPRAQGIAHAGDGGAGMDE